MHGPVNIKFKVRPLLAVRFGWVCSNIVCNFEFTFATVPVKKKVDLSCGG